MQNNIKKSHLDTAPSFVTATTILSTSPIPLSRPLREKEQTVKGRKEGVGIGIEIGKGVVEWRSRDELFEMIMNYLR